MIKLVGMVREEGLGEGRRDGKVNKYKVEEMLKFFGKAFGMDATLSLGGFDIKLVDSIKDNEKVIKELLKSELQREYSGSLDIDINYGNVVDIIEWLDIINNNNPKDFGIIGKQFLYCSSVIEGLISFLKLYKSANSHREDPTFREEGEIVLILIIKTLKATIKNIPELGGIRGELLSKLEEELKELQKYQDFGSDTLSLIFGFGSSTYGNTPKNNKWIEDFIRTVSGVGNSSLVHIIRKSQINKAEILCYVEKNILEVVIEYGSSFIVVLSNSRSWKKEAILLYRTTESQLQNNNKRADIEKIINLFLQGGLPVEKISDLKVIQRSNILSRKAVASEDFYKSIQVSTY